MTRAVFTEAVTITPPMMTVARVVMMLGTGTTAAVLAILPAVVPPTVSGQCR
jgi:hypothetical protein